MMQKHLLEIKKKKERKKLMEACYLWKVWKLEVTCQAFFVKYQRW